MGYPCRNRFLQKTQTSCPFESDNHVQMAVAKKSVARERGIVAGLWQGRGKPWQEMRKANSRASFLGRGKVRGSVAAWRGKGVSFKRPFATLPRLTTHLREKKKEGGE